MKADTKNDVAYVTLRKGKVDSTLEVRPGILLDLDKRGEVLGIELLSLNELAPELKIVGRRVRNRLKY